MIDMHLKDTWENEASLIEYLAGQLVSGRLGLFLGAGTSMFYGLPNWGTLIDRLCAVNGETRDPSDDLIRKAAYLRARYYKDDVPKFLDDLSAALYEGTKLDFARIRQNETLAAIGSLVMSSRRGSAAKVFTLNYDDLLENYLEFHGFTTSVLWSERHWAQNEDVVIYHPHGFLPLANRERSNDIVIGTTDYQEVMKSELWRPLLRTALRTHTFLYIGLSGADQHLDSLMHELIADHAIGAERTAFHGVRFAIEGQKDEQGVVLETLGVFTHRITSYDALPDFLFNVCQAARVIRMRRG